MLDFLILAGVRFNYCNAMYYSRVVNGALCIVLISATRKHGGLRMVRFAKMAVQAAVFSGIFMAVGVQTASSQQNPSLLPAVVSNTSPDVNLGEYLQGDYIRADVFQGTYLQAGFFPVAETRVAQAAPKQPEFQVAQATREQTAV